jgi:inosine-uridine nucleoside N-ribohydrolase
MPPPIPAILDCDPGTDDAVAILLALASPEIDLRALTVVGGNVGLKYTLANSLALVDLAGRSLPIHAGADRPLLKDFVSETRVHGENGIGGITLASNKAADPELAADAIRRILRVSPKPVTLIGTGPATNLGLVLATEPRLAGNVAEIVLMTGAWGEGNVTPAAEFNALNDPEALTILLACGRPVTLVTLDLTAQVLITPARLDKLRLSGQGRCLKTACDILATIPRSPRAAEGGAYLHDPCTIAWLVRPDLFTRRHCAVSVDLGPGPCRGRTVIDRWERSSAPLNATVLERVNVDGLFALLSERLARLP